MQRKHRYSVMERFLAKISVDATTGCWVWIAARLHHGYGQFGFNGKSGKATHAAWKLFKGPIADGLCVLHKCDNTSCVNPDHLYLGTQADNARDRHARGRAMQQRPGYVPWNFGRGRDGGPPQRKSLLRRVSNARKRALIESGRN